MDIMNGFDKQFKEQFGMSDRGGICPCCGRWMSDAGMCDCDEDTGFDADRGGDDAYDKMREEGDL